MRRTTGQRDRITGSGLTAVKTASESTAGSTIAASQSATAVWRRFWTSFADWRNQRRQRQLDRRHRNLLSSLGRCDGHVIDQRAIDRSNP